MAEAIAGEPELGRDAIQDAFAQAIRSRSQFRGESSLEGWVWSVVVNAARSARRRRADVLQSAPEVAIEPASANGSAFDDRLRLLVAGLPERQRLVLFLRYYADLDYEGIAAALEIRPGTVGATLSQAHSAIRRHLMEVPA